MNLVHEHRSSQFFFLFFKKKKSNQIKFDEIFGNKIFVENNNLNAKWIALHYRKCKDNVYTLVYVYD